MYLFFINEVGLGFWNMASKIWKTKKKIQFAEKFLRLFEVFLSHARKSKRTHWEISTHLQNRSWRGAH